MPIRASRFTEEQIGFALNQAETGTPVFSVLRNRSESLRRACACRVKPCKCWCCWGSLYRWLGRFTKVSTDGGASEPANDFFSLASSAETQRIKRTWAGKAVFVPGSPLDYAQLPPLGNQFFAVRVRIPRARRIFRARMPNPGSSVVMLAMCEPPFPPIVMSLIHSAHRDRVLGR